MLDAILTSPFFGLALSAAAWCAGLWVQKKNRVGAVQPPDHRRRADHRHSGRLSHPLGALQPGGEPDPDDAGTGDGGAGPEYLPPARRPQGVFSSGPGRVSGGHLASLGSVLALCRLFQLEEVLTASLLPKSVTTAIALGIAESQGGIQGVAAAAVILAGLVGAVFAPCSPSGSASHRPGGGGTGHRGVQPRPGTTKAMEIGEIQGAMSSIAICVCGIFTSLLALFL